MVSKLTRKELEDLTQRIAECARRERIMYDCLQNLKSRIVWLRKSESLAKMNKDALRMFLDSIDMALAGEDPAFGDL